VIVRFSTLPIKATWRHTSQCLKHFRRSVVLLWPESLPASHPWDPVTACRKSLSRLAPAGTIGGNGTRFPA